MRIAMMTTWDCKCGIAAYSERLANTLVNQGHEVHIYANYKHDMPQDQVVEFGRGEKSPRDPWIHVWKVWSWNGRAGNIQFDVERIKNLLAVDKIDVVHIQYESFLWHHDYITHENFDEIFGDTPVICTFHSSGIHPAWPVGKFAATIQHDVRKQSNGKHNIVPMGVPEWEVKEETEPVLMSFGLGRNDDDFCREAIRLANQDHGTNLSYDAQYGDSKWVSESALQERLQRARYHALIYPPVGAVVSSSAVCQALATRKPVFTSQTNWFKHVDNYVHMVETPYEMAMLLGTYECPAGKYLRNSNDKLFERLMEERSMTKIGEKHLEIYEECLNPSPIE